MTNGAALRSSGENAFPARPVAHICLLLADVGQFGALEQSSPLGRGKNPHSPKEGECGPPANYYSVADPGNGMLAVNTCSAPSGPTTRCVSTSFVPSFTNSRRSTISNKWPRKPRRRYVIGPLSHAGIELSKFPSPGVTVVLPLVS